MSRNFTAPSVTPYSSLCFLSTLSAPIHRCPVLPLSYCRTNASHSRPGNRQRQPLPHQPWVNQGPALSRNRFRHRSQDQCRPRSLEQSSVRRRPLFLSRRCRCEGVLVCICCLAVLIFLYVGFLQGCEACFFFWHVKTTRPVGPCTSSTRRLFPVLSSPGEPLPGVSTVK